MWKLGGGVSVIHIIMCCVSGLAGDGGVMDGLRTELSAIVERSRIGDRKQQELEQIITRLEDEVSRYSSQTIQLEERLADKMAQIASLESKLGQRNLRVVDLQNELEERISENNILQREVRDFDWVLNFSKSLAFFLEVKSLVKTLQRK